MFIELKLTGRGTVGFDASRIECVRDSYIGSGSSCTVTLKSGATFSLPGNYKEVVDRIHKATEEAKQRAQG